MTGRGGGTRDSGGQEDDREGEGLRERGRQCGWSLRVGRAGEPAVVRVCVYVCVGHMRGCVASRVVWCPKMEDALVVAASGEDKSSEEHCYSYYHNC